MCYDGLEVKSKLVGGVGDRIWLAARRPALRDVQKARKYERCSLGLTPRGR